MPARRVPYEQPARPFAGFKLAHAVLAAGDGRAGFAGLSIGRQRVYGTVADACCIWGRRHAPPSRWCGCGFYCLSSLAEARDLSAATENRAAVLLEVAASGRFIRYERGLRYSRQRVRTVRAGPCRCGRPAAGLADAGWGLVGWRGLMPVCTGCAARRDSITLASFARRLGGLVPVGPDEAAAGWPRDTPASPGPAGPPPADGLPAADGLPDTAALAALSAEIAFAHARLDHLQAELSRLQDGPDPG